MPPTVTPLATYRIQLHQRSGFTDAASLIPYLASLGISTLYLSPVFQARPGSTHGYDVIDPTHLNPELGTRAEWSALLRQCSNFGMTVLLDIVPNHMAVSPLNRWWWDVLENGRASPYADYFDIDWKDEGRMKDRVRLPVLTEPLFQVLERGDLQITIEETGLCVNYKGMKLPLDVASYAIVLRRAARATSDDAVKTILKGLAATAQSLADSNDSTRRHVIRDAILRGLDGGALLQDDSMSALFGTTADGPGRSAMRSLLAQQHYVLERWWTARQHLNYRRFFDINDLIAMRVEDWPVFKNTHALLHKLAQHPAVCGFRVDHIDGLKEPLQYLHRLGEISAPSGNAKPYIVVEKILTGDERLRDEWPVAGTTGYEFLSMVNGLFIDAGGLQELEGVYKSTACRPSRRSVLTLRSKRFVLDHLFRADIRRLAAQTGRLPPVVIGKHPPKGSDLEKAIIEVTARVPVYRTYLRPGDGIQPTDRHVIDGAVYAAQESATTSAQQRALAVIRRILTLDVPVDAHQQAMDIVLTWQQTTGAAMAKGFEDTTLYRDPVLVSLNDVGGPPERTAILPEQFHAFNAGRREAWPDTMNCTATHDTKRGEDARARIDVLSEVPDRWAELAKAAARRLPDLRSKTRAEIELPIVLLLLQTLLGVWPPEGPDCPEFLERFRQYTVKAAREAKQNTDWLSPDEHYESSLCDCMEMLVSDTVVRPLLEGLHHITAFHGAINSLAQTLIKAASPGVPDFYQGTELWDLSMVDPDNRRPVDYELRQALLQEIDARAAQDRAGQVREMVDNWPDERSKLYTTVSALRLRKDKETLFAHGAYVPLDTEGLQRDHVFAFMRQDQESEVIVVVPRLTVALTGERKLPLGEAAWGGDVVLAPRNAASVFREVLTGRTIEVQNGSIPLCEAFAIFPFCLMASEG